MATQRKRPRRRVRPRVRRRIGPRVRRRVRRRRSSLAPRRHAVKVDLQVFELSKTGTSLHLEVSARGEKIGDLTIGRGSVIWRGGKRKREKRLRWSKFAEMMDRLFYED